MGFQAPLWRAVAAYRTASLAYAALLLFLDRGNYLWWPRAWAVFAGTVTIRDDGPGIPAGRLADAAADGRLGVSHAIRGRIRDLGGTVSIDPGGWCCRTAPCRTTSRTR
ncbi:MAG: hypothetical protein ACRDNF_07310 [Streptosporangiaceae bacterium]